MPCPQCGGFIHPIAGRCKHCKADLAAQRSTRPAAAAALPALRPLDEAPAPAPYSAPEAVRPPIVALPHAVDDARPILPPRPTGRMEASEPKRSIWRNWPVIVIVLASLAIATAVVLMVYPPTKSAKADSRRLAPPPAPERMDTNPLPPQGNNGAAPPKSSGIDPWSKQNPYAQPDLVAPADPDDDDQIDPDDLAIDPFNKQGGGNAPSDPFGTPGGFGGLGGLGGLQDQFTFTLVHHVCARAKTCGNSQLTATCATVDQLVQGGKPPTCASGQRCLAKIDQLDCDVLTPDNLLGAATLAQDCIEALQSC